jgi:hypothetical protein
MELVSWTFYFSDSVANPVIKPSWPISLQIGVSHCFHMCSGTWKTEGKFCNRNDSGTGTFFSLSCVRSAIFHNNFYPAKTFGTFRIRISNTASLFPETRALKFITYYLQVSNIMIFLSNKFSF